MTALNSRLGDDVLATMVGRCGYRMVGTLDADSGTVGTRQWGDGDRRGGRYSYGGWKKSGSGRLMLVCCGYK
ncbi:hypothetical protein SESBI_12507 [Sesbania bispinosa]|nr:hypothetical protein SESBI_12507 [Sesbania bispinosa]